MADNCIDVYYKLDRYYLTGNSIDFALNYKDLGGDVTEMTILGNDVFADALEERLKEREIPLRILKRTDRPTAAAKMDLVDGDKKHLHFEGNAMEEIELQDDDLEFVKQFDIIYAERWAKVGRYIKEIRQEDDEVAACVQDTLKEIGIDDSHCRRYEGENGFALVTLKETDRVFLGSNKGGIAKEHDFGFTKEDLEYIKGFHLIYTNLNSYIEKELPVLYQTGVPVAYDFSTRWTDEYLKEICPYVTVAIMSCAHLTDEEREKEMRKAQSYGVKVVLGTIGEDGSYVLYNDKILYAPAVHADDVIDTMGAGDSYFSAFLCSLLETSKEGKIVEGTDEEMAKRLQTAMGKGAVFAAKVCALEGAFGYGVPILGKTTV